MTARSPKKTGSRATALANGFWPGPLKHCARPLVGDTDEEIIIGEVTDEPVDGFTGNRMLFAAMVPLTDVASVLGTVGGIGHGVRVDPRQAAYGTAHRYFPAFWIDGPGPKRFESLVHTWLNHNKRVFVPGNALLMSYGLIPRTPKDGSISWDDPDRLVYDVVRVIPLSTYTIREGSTTARVTIRREYLEDYLSLRECAAVATYWDERFSSDHPEVTALIGKEGAKFEQPGRELWFLPTERPSANQVSQVWGCALMLSPKGQPISEPIEPALTWPDRRLPVQGSGRQASFELETAYVRDEVLTAYENREEFEISPEHGFVSYDGRWSVSHCNRVGRNHLELELRKLYEGAPFEVIRHFNNFAVSAALADNDRKTHGERHIGIRARDLVRAFLGLTATLGRLCEVTGLSFTQKEICQLDPAEVEYRGWWTFAGLKSLGHVVPMTLTLPGFLNRCKENFKLLENVQPAPLRQILIRLGVNKDAIAEFGGVKLLATVCQLATISKENGFALVADSARVSAMWDVNRAIPELRPLFAVNALRTAEAHKLTKSTSGKVSEALQVLGIDEMQCRAGWGKALDRVYDQMVSSLEQIDTLLSEAMNLLRE